MTVSVYGSLTFSTGSFGSLRDRLADRDHERPIDRRGGAAPRLRRRRPRRRVAPCTPSPSVTARLMSMFGGAGHAHRDDVGGCPPGHLHEEHVAIAVLRRQALAEIAGDRLAGRDHCSRARGRCSARAPRSSGGGSRITNQRRRRRAPSTSARRARRHVTRGASPRSNASMSERRSRRSLSLVLVGATCSAPPAQRRDSARAARSSRRRSRRRLLDRLRRARRRSASVRRIRRERLATQVIDLRIDAHASGARIDGASGSAVRCFVSTPTAVEPGTGAAPVSTSNISAPNE